MQRNSKLKLVVCFYVTYYELKQRMQNNLSDKIILGLSSSINSIFEMDEQLKSKISSVIGVLVTLYSLRKIEQKFKELVLSLISPKIFLFILLLILLIGIIHFLIETNAFTRIVKYASQNIRLEYLIFFSIVISSIFVFRYQFFVSKNRPKNEPYTPLPITQTQDEFIEKNETISKDFNQQFLLLISNIYDKHLNPGYFGLIFDSNFNDKCFYDEEIVRKDAIDLFEFLKIQIDEKPQDKIQSLLDFWTFMIKTGLVSILILAIIYFIIRALLWLIMENNLQSKNDNFLNPNKTETETEIEIEAPKFNLDTSDSSNAREEAKIENSSFSINKKRGNYIKNSSTKTSLNRISVKSRNKKAQKISSSLGDLNAKQNSFDFEDSYLDEDEDVYSDQFRDFYDSSDSASISTVIDSDLSVYDAEQAYESNFDFLIKWLTNGCSSKDFDLEKQIEFDLPDMLNKSIKNMEIVSYKNF